MPKQHDAKPPCLHCALRGLIVKFATDNPDLSSDDVVEALAHVTGEFIGSVEEAYVRESFFHAAVIEISNSIMEEIVAQETPEADPEVAPPKEHQH